MGMFNFSGAVFYLVVASLAWCAAVHCGRVPGGQGARGRAFRWRAVALVFVVLAAWRIGQGEAIVQDWARDTAHAAGSYALRRQWQAPLAALVVLAGGAWMLRLAALRRVDVLLHWSRFASLALVAYSSLRLVSFHPVDALIYRGIGPFHLNHVIDLGLAGVVGCCAVVAARRARRAAAAQRRG